ncbi:MAG: hypothetical protein J0J15_33100, partial [Mesorhizobium sp.]|nr:hypothetical protein [Mesorhizobium sp.]
MTPAEAIAALDRDLAAVGEDCTLRRPHAYQSPTLLPSLQLSRGPVATAAPVSVEENGVALEGGTGFRIEPKS